MRFIKVVKVVRTGLWHFRHGGFFQFINWLRPRLAARGMIAPELGPWEEDAVEAYLPLSLPKTFGDIRVATILDDFSRAAWGGEFTLVELSSSGWKRQIESEGVDLLLVESAWNGNGGEWQYKLTGTSAPSPEVVDLLTYCKSLGIPSIFWNKEDPPHFEDFIKTASLFDVILTSDSSMVAKYKERVGHHRVFPMAFAAAPAIHNPVRRGEPFQIGDAAFAGMYFSHKFPERRRQMEILLSAAVKVGPAMQSGLVIFSRFKGGDLRYQFPKPFSKYVVGSLDYVKMLTAYRGFKVFLNVNSVVDSPSMCARRIFEISASGTPVVSTPSAAIGRFFNADEVAVVDSQEEAEWMIRGLVNSKQLRDRMVHRAQRKIWTQHTYAHRAEQILTSAEIDHKRLSLPQVSIIASTNRPHQIDHLLTQVASQEDIEIQLLLMCHGFSIDKRDLLSRAEILGVSDLSVFYAPRQWSLGESLNFLVDRADSPVIAKFDDDDLYGRNYLLDQINALKFSGSDLVGKECNYIYDESSNLTILRRPEREHRYTEFVSGPTLVGSRDIFRASPFEPRNRGEDTTFLRAVSKRGGRIYSADRFNFLQMRHQGGHTWEVDSSELLANGVVEVVGYHPDHVWC